VRLSALEVPARWGCVRENLALVGELLGRGKTDLALLPEASLTGYVSPDAERFDLGQFAEDRDGPTARALAALAKQHGTHLVGPLIERDGPHLYNAMIGFDPTGRELIRYRKRHPWYPEQWATPGDLPHPVVTVGDTTVTIAVCFDIHFAKEIPSADVLLFPSAWVESPEDSREALLGALDACVVNANWGTGTPRIRGQGGTMILDRGVVVARATEGRADYTYTKRL
jgi:predicted amidohydrolase